MISSLFKKKKPQEPAKSAGVKLPAASIQAKLDACLYRQAILEQESKNNLLKIDELKKQLKEAK